MKFKAILIVALLLIASVGWSADWYVRPSGGSYGDEDGTSYTNAWDGFSNITWGSGGVVAGDTLYLDGSTTYKEVLTITVDDCIINGSYGGGKATIDGETSRGGIVQRADMPIIRNIIIRNTVNNSIGCDAGHPCKVYDVEIYDSGNNAIELHGDNGVISRCTFDTMNNSGIVFDNGGSGWTISNCTISACANNDGITLHNGIGSNYTIKNCTISDCAENAIDIAANFSSIVIEKVTGSSTQAVFYNKGDATFTNCIASGSEHSGFEVDTSATTTLENCLVCGCGTVADSSGIACRASTATEIYNCTFYTTGTRYSIITDSATSVILKNSIIYTPNHRCFYIDDAGTSLTFDYNDLYFNDKVGFIEATGYNTFADWRTGTSQDAHSIDDDPTLNDSHYLKKSSPCIDAGVTISGITEEYYGSAVDIGAFEYDRLSGVGFGLGLMNYRRLKRTKP